MKKGSSGIKKKKEDNSLKIERKKLIHLAELIIKHWDIKVHDIELIQGGEMALVWKMQTDLGPLCLKRLHRQEKKALFSIHAQNYLKKKGVFVPGIFPNKENALFTKFGSFLFVVYEWIEGTHLSEENIQDLEVLMKGLAHFHQASIGYKPPQGVPVFSKLGKWPNHYMKRCQQLKSWKYFAMEMADDPFSKTYLKEIDTIIENGYRIHNKLLASIYPSWVEQTMKTPNLCHPDYGGGNTLLGDDGKFYVIDLDTTCFDLPIRDLRKILDSHRGPSVHLDENLFNTIMNAYESVTPLTKKQKQVMFIDMMFPDELHSLVQSKYIEKEKIGVEELIEAIEFERNKEKILSKLL